MTENTEKPTASPVTGSGEPFAWHCVGAGEGWQEDKVSRDPELVAAYQNSPHWRVVPLYAAPVTGSESPADQIIAQIENLFPDWRSYRDLVDCIECTLHALKGAARG